MPNLLNPFISEDTFFYILAPVNNAAVNMRVQFFFFFEIVLFSLSMDPEMRLLYPSIITFNPYSHPW